jgi:FdhD protein
MNRAVSSVDDKTSANVTYVRYDGDQGRQVERPVVREAPWTIRVNDQELVTLFCTPEKLNFLVLGFLASEGVIESLEDVLLVQFCEDQEGVIEVKLKERELHLPDHPILLSGCGRGVTFEGLSTSQSPIESSLQIPAERLSGLMRELRQQAEIHQAAGGTHASGLCDGDRLLVVAEDVGRHNTLDKIRGECLFGGIQTKDRILVTTGRISSEMVIKAVKMQVPIVASRSTPTDLAIRLASDWHMTVVGYVRGHKMNVYTHPDRMVLR